MAKACNPTNMSKVYDIRQGVDKSPTAYLEILLEAFQKYTPCESSQMVMFAFINQAASNIRKNYIL